jgi:hypothetical protein
MTTQDLLKPLYDTLEKAQELTRLAQSEEWLAFEQQFANYEQLAKYLSDETYLKALNDNNLGASGRELILEIQALNETLDLCATDVRDKIASELRQMMQSDKALDAYRR